MKRTKLGLAFVGILTLCSGGPAFPGADDKPAPGPAWLRTAQSGPWSAAATWENGKVPTAGSRVQIRTGHAVTYDMKSDQIIRAIHVAGTLRFAQDRDTLLHVGLIKIQAGDQASEDGFDCDAHLPDGDPSQARPALEVGALDQPVPAQHSAVIRLVYIDGMDKESCPAIVCCGGRMDFHGAPLSRTWVKLGATANKGAKTVTLAEEVKGWRVGDRLIVTATKGTHKASGTRRPDKRTQEVFTEERIITAIQGSELTLDKGLEHEHLGVGDFRGAVANLSRNVVVESADPKGLRGHTMYHRGSAGSISYAEFRHLGKEGLLGRYALHYHLCGDTMRGSSVIGASIWDSHNRWLTIHGTNYLVVRDCVGYQSVGHGFFLEDGTEVYNVLDRNLAVQAFAGKKLPKQVLIDDPNDGAGFWWANSHNAFTRNVSCENDRYGFRYDASPIVSRAASVTFRILQPDGSRKPVDIRTLPFVRFENNEAHCDGAYGLNLGNGVERVGPDRRHPFVIRGMKIWEVHLAFVPAPPCVLVEDMTIYKTEYGVYLPNYDHHVYRNLRMIDVNAEPFNRGHDDRSIQYGPLTVDGLTFEGNCGNPLIQISDDNPTGTAESHFRNVKVVGRPANRAKYALVNMGVSPRYGPTTPQGVPVYLHDYFGDGRHAKVVSTRAKDLLSDGNKYREETPLTGDESRVAEVKDVLFPHKLLSYRDYLPPITMITHVNRRPGQLVVRGTTTDNEDGASVFVNGQRAKITSPQSGEWEIVLTGAAADVKELRAHAEDLAGIEEQRPHVLVLTQGPEVPKAPKGFDVRRSDIDRGQIATLEYESTTVGAKRKLVVYTPPGFDKEKKYPVFYLLHGKGGNETHWTKLGRAGDILDNLYADKKLVPMIVVMPNGEVPSAGKKDFTSGFENELLKDVMPLVESRYPLLPGPENRALAGLSMGGGQSLRIGLKHLDKFAWIGGFSSAIFGKANIPGDSAEAAKKIRLLWVACGDSDTLLNANKSFHASLEQQKIPHTWHLESGGHTFAVWRNDLYLFAQQLFRDKDKKE